MSDVVEISPFTFCFKSQNLFGCSVLFHSKVVLVHVADIIRLVGSSLAAPNLGVGT